MIVNEDGGVTGSINVSQLDSVEAKTDEAKAQIDALKRDVQQGQEQAQADSDRLAQAAVDSNPLVDEKPQDNRDAQGKSVAPSDSGDQPDKGSDKAQASKPASSSTDKGSDKAQASKPASSSTDKG